MGCGREARERQAAHKTRIQWERRCSKSRLEANAGHSQDGISDQTLTASQKTQGPNMLSDWECWNSIVANRGQHIPLGCVMLATIDLQFGLFLLQFK